MEENNRTSAAFFIRGITAKDRCRFAGARRAAALDPYLTPAWRIDQAVQVDRGLEGRVVAFAVADRPMSNSLSEQRVHLTDVYGFT
jgi:hypothetical protein